MIFIWQAIFWSIIINVIVMGWIIIGAQIYIAQGKLIYNSLSTTIDNCPNINVTSFKLMEISLRYAPKIIQIVRHIEFDFTTILQSIMFNFISEMKLHII